MAVAADDDRRNAGQGEAGNVRVGTGKQAGTEPDIGGAQSQMHVIGDDGTTVRRQRSRHREIVAADRFGLPVRQECQLRRRHGVEVDLVGVGNAHRDFRLAEQGRIPLRLGFGQQGVNRTGQGAFQLPEFEFTLVAFILKVEEHRITDQKRILRFPGFWLGIEQEIGPGSDREIRKPGIDAIGISLQHAGIAAGHLRVMLADARTQAMDADGLVFFHGHGTEQRRQFTGGGTPEQIHFKIAFLGMHIAERASHVGLVGRFDGDRAIAVTADFYRLGEIRKLLASFKLWQAATQKEVCAGREHDHNQQQRNQCAFGPGQQCHETDS